MKAYEAEEALDICVRILPHPELATHLKMILSCFLYTIARELACPKRCPYVATEHV